MELRNYQLKANKDIFSEFDSGKKSVCCVLPTGAGKCLGENEKVIMFDGSIKSVKEIKIGDKLLGPDSKERIVKSTSKGFGDLYKIIPVKGKSWICNDVHVLTLVETESGFVFDIELDHYLKKSKWFKHIHKLFSPQYGVDFSNELELDLDPYFLGVWFGDGTKEIVNNKLSSVCISKPNKEIEELCNNIATEYGLYCTMYVSGNNSPTYRISNHHSGGKPNILLNKIRDLVGPNLEIPKCIKNGSKEIRRKFLAGFLDSDGHLSRGCFEIVQKRKDYIDDIIYISKSLGLGAQEGSIKVVNGCNYYRVVISGELTQLPIKIKRKIPEERKQIKIPTRTGFSVEFVGQGDYYGFELENSDGRFLLDDFTVTHNTTVGVSCVLEHIRRNRGASIVWLAPLRELIEQTKKYFPTYVDVVTVDENTDLQETMFPRIHVSTVQSLSKNGRKFRPRASFVVLDEAQFFFGTPEWNQVAKYYINNGAKVLSLTATPARQDGSPLSELADSLVVGPSTKELINLKHLVKCDVFSIDFKYNTYDPISSYIKYAKDSKAAVFCSTVDEAKDLSEEFNKCGILATFAHAGDRRGVELHKTNQVKVLCNVYLLSYGYDDPSIETIILNRGSSNPTTYLQMVGRGLRLFGNKESCKFIDLFGVIHKPNFGLPDDEREYSLEHQAITLKIDRFINTLVPGVDFTVIE